MDIIFQQTSSPLRRNHHQVFTALTKWQSTVKGIRVTVSEVVIAEVSGLSTEGAVWPKKHIMLHDAVEIFRDVDKELTRKGKGIQPSSLGEPCANEQVSSRVTSPMMVTGMW